MACSSSTMETRARLSACWEVDIKWDLYPKKVREGCEQVGKAMSMPATAILSGLLVLVGFMLAHSKVEVAGTEWVEPVILWMSIGMPTGSGKSTVFNYLLGLLRDVRERCCKDFDPPWTVDEASFEKMGAIMAENNSKLLGLYDELSSFLTRINLYSSKGISDSHDMATFLMLYNGHPWTRRTVTGQANFQMDHTALSVGGFTQPSVARTLIEQQSSAERGFCQRFLWIFPKPVFGKFKSLEPVKSDFNKSIVDLLQELWVDGGGSKPKLRIWKLPRHSPEFEEKFDRIQEELAELSGKDDLLTGVLSKAKGQILRAAAVLHALFSIDPLHPRSEELSSMSIVAAINLIEVCNEHTAFIGGRKGITAAMTPLSPQGPRQACDDESNASYVLTLPGSVMDLTALLNNKKFRGRGNKEGAIRVFQLLQQDQLGQLEARRGRNSKQYQFRKRPLPPSGDEEQQAELAAKLMKYSVSLPAYVSAIEDVNNPWEVVEEPKRSPRKKDPTVPVLDPQEDSVASQC